MIKTGYMHEELCSMTHFQEEAKVNLEKAN